MSGRRVGIFGGAFDPPHLGHRGLAQTATRTLQLDALHIIPTGDAWHKPRALTPAVHRVAMCRLNFQDVPGVVVDDREIRRSGPSYTVDTVMELQQVYPDAQLYVCLGLDQALALPSWSRWEQLVANATICVAVRPDFIDDAAASQALNAMVPSHCVLPMEPLALSSTEIRHRVAQRKRVSGLVFEPVARYIDQHFLYQSI